MMGAKPYDVYHLHIPFPLGLEIALVASKKNQKPLVATHHGQWTRGAPLYTLIASSYNLFSRAISLRGVDCPIFLTSSYADSLWLPRAVRRRVQIVPTGADIHSFSPDLDGSQIRRRYQLDDGAALALFVGSLNASNRYKGVDYLIRALPEIQKTVRNVRLMVVGGGPLLKELQDLTRQMGLDDTVVFTGPIANSLLPDYYAAADVFVLPSIRGPENSPVVVFEAMSSARPVVASRLPGVREIVRHEETGLLAPPGDIEALAAALVRVFTDHDFRASAGRKARARAEGYSWDHCAAKIETIFQELVSR
jgi:glycosyltransferase involved in cell wall biosynthesis